jgi:UDP-N-acetylmuramyl pentapeptide phosphotransferase/UDP-N-acetylglucosamine-1-phosphate transferase
MVLFTFLIFGLADDFLNFKANKKFALQFILIGFFLYNSNDIINISQIIGLNKEYKIFNLIFSILLMNILVNSINLIDGSDGLAASISIIINGFLAYYFISIEDIYHSMLSCSLLGSIIGFMYFNKPPAKIFMGNGGSLFIGMILSILIFNFLNHYDNDQIFIFDQSLKIKIAFALFSIPALDLIRVMLFRVYKRRNPFIGDSNHIHHKLKAMGYKSKYIVLFIIISQIFIFTLSFVDFYKNGFIFFINSVILSYSMTILIISQIQNEIKEDNNRSNGIKKVENNFEKVDKIEANKLELYN